MTFDEFWALIDASRPVRPDPDRHAETLVQALVGVGVSECAAFSRHFDQAIDALYRWDIWGVAYLLRGGCSDDGFEYFRAWIVGEGAQTWAAIQADPEGFGVALIDRIAAGQEPFDDWLAERNSCEAESLMYAASTAHESLTGEPIPVDADFHANRPVEPTGAAWDEDAVELTFPRLAAALATVTATNGGNIHGVGPADAPPLTRIALVEAMLGADQAWSVGDHPATVRAMQAVLDDPAAHDVAIEAGFDEEFETATYQAGMSRFIGGDPDGAARWLRIVAHRPGASRSVTRGLAQIELAAGNLDACEQLLTLDADAAPFDLGIWTVVASRRGDRDAVIERAQATHALLATTGPSMHQWDIAGVNVLLGVSFVEVGEGHAALDAARNALDLVEDAPPEVPITAQALTVAAGGCRLIGEIDRAHELLAAAWGRFEPDTSDLGAAQREAARCHRAADDRDRAREFYAQASATFRAAGERWDGEATDREAAELT